LTTLKYDKQDQQGKAAFNERNPHMTQPLAITHVIKKMDKIRATFNGCHTALDTCCCEVQNSGNKVIPQKH
jgi:hypothetical protein